MNIINLKSEKLYTELNLHYTKIANRTRASSILELPRLDCKIKEFLPTYLALYHQPEDYTKNGLNTGICFFTDDHRFDNKEGLYNAIYYNDINKLKFYRDRFKNVKLFIEPDYTICGDMHFAEKVSRRFKMRIVAVWLATELQAMVIPLITYGNERSFKYMLDGIEDSNTVAFSTKGSVRNTKKHPRQKELLLDAIKYTVDNLNLRYIVVYSTCKYETTCKLFSYATDRGVQLIIPGNRLKGLHDKRRN
ncbi:MAG: DUF4417 domain-containing protein [Selenomonadaceae bacterium]|nr:DUF4417 domain-containing protein [Selenomonadaceae bacterium]MBQ3727310.1 DUF4417 domain-containing protein [Selenomonadaceae bacterium]MBQ9497585.1 DUF4417 domain-containing protein [Selenomonadaceae bacterium]